MAGESRPEGPGAHQQEVENARAVRESCEAWLRRYGVPDAPSHPDDDDDDAPVAGTEEYCSIGDESWP